MYQREAVKPATKQRQDEQGTRHDYRTGRENHEREKGDGDGNKQSALVAEIDLRRLGRGRRSSGRRGRRLCFLFAQARDVFLILRLAAAMAESRVVGKLGSASTLHVLNFSLSRSTVAHAFSVPR
jgi:hypothetical protein